MEGDAERTEDPTPRRREEARQEGKVAVSQDLSSGVLLLAGLILLALAAGTMGSGFLHAFRQEVELLPHQEITLESAPARLTRTIEQVLLLAGPILGLLFFVAAGMGFLQVGFQVNPDLLGFRWDRIDPTTGWARVFSLPSLVRGLSALLKITLIGSLAYWVLRGREGLITTLSEGSLKNAVSQGWALVARLGITMAGGLVLLGILDYLFQRFRFEKSLRMTRQELKEEMKREEGNPEIKARIRKLQREAAQQKMFRDIPKAAVVITNPIHLAIALQYDRDKMGAPRVVAKGSEELAQRIVKIAREHNVPIVERVSLARAFSNPCKSARKIPPALPGGRGGPGVCPSAERPPAELITRHFPAPIRPEKGLKTSPAVRYNIPMKVCLFDIDGTILSSGGAGKAALETAFTEDFGKPIHTHIPYSGRTDRAIIRDLFRCHGVEETPSNLERIFQGYLARLPACLNHHQGTVLPGIIFLIEEFRRREVPLGLLTGNVRRGAQAKLGHFGLADHFPFGGFGDHHFDRDDVAREALAEVHRHLGPDVLGQEIWIIGDTPLDVRCARAIGARVLAVATGVHSLEMLAQAEPDLLLPDLSCPENFFQILD